MPSHLLSLLGLTFVAASTACSALPPAVYADPREVPSDRSGRAEIDVRFWTWDRPLGSAAQSDAIVWMVRVNIALLAPHAAADSVCNAIRRRNLGAGDVCILLQNFGLAHGDPSGPSWSAGGRTPLFLHHADGLGRQDTLSWWLTPWMTNGVQDTREWVNAFIARYKRHQAEHPDIPDPSRFHFDSETPLYPWSALGTHRNTFHAMQNDPRWHTEEIFGWDKTLEQLYEEAGRPQYHFGVSGYSPRNAEWANWYTGIVVQAIEGAMNAAAYEPIRTAWPGCKSSNFATSAGLDGQEGRVFRGHRHEHLHYHHRAFGDLKAPVFYSIPTPAGDPSAGESLLSNVSKHLQDYIASGGEENPQLITPWILLPGQPLERGGQVVALPASHAQRLIQLLYAEGIREFLVWNDSNAQTTGNWNNLAEIVSQLGEHESED